MLLLLYYMFAFPEQYRKTIGFFRWWYCLCSLQLFPKNVLIIGHFIGNLHVTVSKKKTSEASCSMIDFGGKNNNYKVRKLFGIERSRAETGGLSFKAGPLWNADLIILLFVNHGFDPSQGWGESQVTSSHNISNNKCSKSVYFWHNLWQISSNVML